MAPMAPVLLGGYDASMRRGASSAAEGPNHPYKMPKVEGTPAVLVTSSLEDWLRPEGMIYQGFLFPRPATWPAYQKEIDMAIGRFGPEGQVEKRILGSSGSDANYELDFQQAAGELLSRVKLPEELSKLLQLDAGRMGSTVARLCPWSNVFQLKLELMGEHTCQRWHRDHYCGRAIITYNLCGTEYTSEENVDNWELENCGNNDCIIRDTSKIRQISVGDMLFIKGRGFPQGAKGLVHKSPAVTESGGMVLNRLVLKVDVPIVGENR